MSPFALLLACAHPASPPAAPYAGTGSTLNAPAELPEVPRGLDPAYYRPRAGEIVAAWRAGTGQPLPVSDDLAQDVTLATFLGTWLFRMDMATARAAEALGPLAVGDPRWARVYLARLEPDASEDASCCFQVHFPALVDGGAATWLYASAGWGPDRGSVFDPSFTLEDRDGLPVDFQSIGSGEVGRDDIRLVLPPTGPMDPALARRVRLLQQVSASPPVVPWKTYSTAVLALSDFDGPDLLRIYMLPSTTDPDTVLVGGWLVWNVQAGSDRLGEPVRYGASPLVFSGPDLEARGQGMVLVSSATLRTPTEAHVFASLTHHLPIAVSTTYGLWWVDQGTVHLLAIWD